MKKKLVLMYYGNAYMHQNYFKLVLFFLKLLKTNHDKYFMVKNNFPRVRFLKENFLWLENGALLGFLFMTWIFNLSHAHGSAWHHQIHLNQSFKLPVTLLSWKTNLFLQAMHNMEDEIYIQFSQLSKQTPEGDTVCIKIHQPLFNLLFLSWRWLVCSKILAYVSFYYLYKFPLACFTDS